MLGDIHGGNPRASAKELGLHGASSVRLDFSVNLNPLGPSCAVARVVQSSLLAAEGYPEIDAFSSEASLASSLGLPQERVILCAGATEALSLALQATRPSLAAWCPPSYSGYAELCAKLGVKDFQAPFKTDGLLFSPDFEALNASAADFVFLCSPSNPTGQLLAPESVLALAEAKPRRLTVLDESFMDFSARASSFSLLGKRVPDNLLLVKSLTKFHCVAGLRLGFAVGAEPLISAMKRLRLPWSVNGLAQAVAPLLLTDSAYAKESVAETSRLRKLFVEGLSRIPEIEVCPSETNYVLCRLAAPATAESVQRKLLEAGILIRSCAEVAGLGQAWIRLAARPEEEQRELLEALPLALAGRTPRAPRGRTKALMVVGTSSDSGKSVVAAALCRVLSDRGFDVAPFKAQNMSLNSYVDKAGGEMGRAQVVQALAARVEPSCDMNPVLLKPTGEARSQVIVDGQPLANAEAREYYSMKEQVRERAFAAFDRLAVKHELVVLEGAGSPAEINLLDNDFVNLRMAERAGAKALLVADIDRGGVFASIFGTLALLPPKWRKLVAGVVINKFRGDKSLLDSGVAEIERLCGVPVLGVIPWLKSLDVDEEDSLGLKKRDAVSRALVDIAVIRLPSMSNFTDFAAFEASSAASVRYVSSPRALGSPDLIAIPGSKCTIKDMLFLKESGLAAKIVELRSSGVPVVGICGGYQMLGLRVDDPAGVESSTRSVEGLGLLPLETVLEPGKELAQVSGVALPLPPFLKEERAFSGYEIHCGRTRFAGEGVQPLRINSRRGASCSELAGALSSDGLVFGSYVHGLFDSDLLRLDLLRWLCERKGVDAAAVLSQPPRAQAQELELRRLAKAFEKNVDVERILSWLAPKKA